jgi:hypothetical protein
VNDGTPFVMQDDRGRRVTVEADGTVTKTFTGVAAREEANREADRLARFHRALDGVEGVTCPSLLSVDGPPWRVHMSLVDGEPLSARLARSELSRAERDALAGLLAMGLTAYVRTFAEPYYDFHLRNVVSAPDATVAFVDFGVPAELAGVLDTLHRRHPIEVSLGNLVGSTVFEAMRPRSARVPEPNRAQTFALVRSVVDSFVGSHEDVTAAGVASMADVSYRQSAHRGSLVRRAWYMVRADATGRARRAIARICSQRP